MRRRDFIAGLGAAAWPLAARAQQPAKPVIGVLFSGSLEATRDDLAMFLRGLAETGYVEGRNVAIEYRWADYRADRLPALAADLVRRKVAVIATAPTPSALAAGAATRDIPIVFVIGADPVQIGLVASLSRPGGNLTGVAVLNSELAKKTPRTAARNGAGSHFDRSFDQSDQPGFYRRRIAGGASCGSCSRVAPADLECRYAERNRGCF